MALPVAAMARESDLYNGLRQLLFIAPALALLATIGVVATLSWSRFGSPRWRTAVGLVAVAAMALPTFDQVRLFPYNYVHYSAIADMVGIVPESDYWRTSVRELAPAIPPSGRVMCSPYFVAGRASRYSFDGNEGCGHDRIGPLAPYNNLRSGVVGRPLEETEFWAVVERRETVPENCSRMAGVTRPLRWRTLVMSYVARCDLPFPEYDGSVVRFGVWPQGWEYLVEGWSSRPAPVGVSSVSDTGTLAFRLPDGLRDRDLSVRVGVQSEGSLSIEVNGRPADVASSPHDRTRVVLARLPAGAVSSDAAKALVIKVRTDEGRLTLESLEVAAD